MKSRRELALELVQALNPGLGECITLGTTARQLDLFGGSAAATETTAPDPEE